MLDLAVLNYGIRDENLRMVPLESCAAQQALNLTLMQPLLYLREHPPWLSKWS